MAARSARAPHRRLAHAGRDLGGREPVGIGLLVDEPERVDRLQAGVTLGERAGVESTPTRSRAGSRKWWPQFGQTRPTLSSCLLNSISSHDGHFVHRSAGNESFRGRNGQTDRHRRHRASASPAACAAACGEGCVEQPPLHGSAAARRTHRASHRTRRLADRPGAPPRRQATYAPATESAADVSAPPMSSGRSTETDGSGRRTRRGPRRRPGANGITSATALVSPARSCAATSWSRAARRSSNRNDGWTRSSSAASTSAAARTSGSRSTSASAATAWRSREANSDSRYRSVRSASTSRRSRSSRLTDPSLESPGRPGARRSAVGAVRVEPSRDRPKRAMDQHPYGTLGAAEDGGDLGRGHLVHEAQQQRAAPVGRQVGDRGHRIGHARTGDRLACRIPDSASRRGYRRAGPGSRQPVAGVPDARTSPRCARSGTARRGRSRARRDRPASRRPAPRSRARATSACMNTRSVTSSASAWWPSS